MAARPPRLGLLVDAEVKGIHWLRIFESALAAQTRFWGGQGNLLFPRTRNFTDNEVFWALADIFDADAFVTYAPTWEEMKDIEPKIYEDEMSRLRKEITDRTSADEAERFISQTHGEAVFHPSMPKEQIALLNSRLAPLSDPGPDDRSLKWFDGSHSAGWPLTDISEFEILPPKVATPVATEFGAAKRLLLTALQGRCPAVLTRLIEERGIELVEQPVDKYEMYSLVRGRNQLDLPGPWGLSMFGLSTFYAPRLLRAPAALVVGDSPWDFALFYALLRMTGRAWWLPSWLRRDQSYAIALESSVRFDSNQDGREAVVVSTSSPAMRDAVAQTLLGRVDERMDIADWRDVLPEEPMEVLDSDTSGRARLFPIVDGRVLELDTPAPSVARTKRPAEMRWISEARSSEWAPARNRALGASLVVGDSDMVRTSRHGVAYFSTSSFILSGASLGSVIVRPSLRPLPLADQIQGLLERKGWRCETSDKAIYALESIKLFGGFNELCKAIVSPQIRAILDAYRSEKGPGARLSSDRRRYLTYRHFEELLHLDDPRPVIEPLLDQNVLIRGVVLKCGRCRQTAWYSASMTPNRFSCDRCGLDQEAHRDAWFGSAEPVLSYRLAEVVFQLFEHNGEVPLLAAMEAFGDSQNPLGRGYELSIAPPDEKTQEVDIFQSDGYRLWIGEASTTPRLTPERLGFLSRLAEVLDAYGVLLATPKPAWSDATEKAARALFPGPWPRLRLLVDVQTHPSDDGRELSRPSKGQPTDD